VAVFQKLLVEVVGRMDYRYERHKQQGDHI
jgi:hypothetical protein